MKTCTFRKSTVLDAPIDAVFAFHENPHNISRISPPSLRIRHVEANPEAVKGETFRIEGSQYFFPIRWEGIWDRVEPPRLLADRALRSPFARFRHEHRFESMEFGSQTRMTDTVDYALPGGEFGFALGQTFTRLALAIMFWQRHRATRKYFAGSVTDAPVHSPLRGSGRWFAAALAVGGLLWAVSRHRRGR